jgi:hypothetical protein
MISARAGRLGERPVFVGDLFVSTNYSLLKKKGSLGIFVVTPPNAVLFTAKIKEPTQHRAAHFWLGRYNAQT